MGGIFLDNLSKRRMYGFYCDAFFFSTVTFLPDIYPAPVFKCSILIGLEMYWRGEVILVKVLSFFLRFISIISKLSRKPQQISKRSKMPSETILCLKIGTRRLVEKLTEKKYAYCKINYF